MSLLIPINLAIEDDLSEAVLRRILQTRYVWVSVTNEVDLAISKRRYVDSTMPQRGCPT